MNDGIFSEEFQYSELNKPLHPKSSGKNVRGTSIRTNNRIDADGTKETWLIRVHNFFKHIGRPCSSREMEDHFVRTVGLRKRTTAQARISELVECGSILYVKDVFYDGSFREGYMATTVTPKRRKKAPTFAEKTQCLMNCLITIHDEATTESLKKFVRASLIDIKYLPDNFDSDKIGALDVKPKKDRNR